MLNLFKKMHEMMVRGYEVEITSDRLGMRIETSRGGLTTSTVVGWKLIAAKALESHLVDAIETHSLKLDNALMDSDVQREIALH